MTSTRTAERASITPRSTMLWVGGVAALWLAMALARSGTTFHLGPLLVTAIPLVVARKEDFALQVTALAAAIGLGVIGTLWATGNLNGPALDPFPSALSESVAFLVAGIAIGATGIVIARRA